MTYETVREFAGSWMLLFMVIFFVGAVLWVFRPGAGKAYRESADMIFRNEDAPAPDTPGAEAEQGRKEARG